MGPIPRLQISFNIINERYAELDHVRLSLAIEMVRDLTYVGDLAVLRQLNLGSRGQGFFENMYKVVPLKKLCWQVYAASVIFGAHRPWVKRLIFDNQFTGSVLRPLTSVRRNVEKKNVVHFFALGVSEAYPSLTFQDIARVMDHPEALLRDGYLRAINLVVPCLREDLTEAILTCVDPDDDPEEAVYELHRVMQTNNLFSQSVMATQQGQERLPARDFMELCGYLANQPEHELSRFAGKGMKESLRKADQVQKSRTSSDVDQATLAKRIRGTLSGKMKPAFEATTKISLSMSKEDLGYRHNDYQVYVAAQCSSATHRVVPMQLGPGQGKTYIAILLAKIHASRGQKACIVVHSNLAKVQYMQILNKYEHEGVHVMEACRLKAEADYHTYILDESDELLLNHSVHFVQQAQSLRFGLYGLAAAYHGKRVYLMSATSEPYI